MFLLWLACTLKKESVSSAESKESSCLAPLDKATGKDPEAWLKHASPDQGSILLLGEHHEQVVQIEALTQTISLLAHQRDQFSFAAEWLPASATEKANTLVQNKEWDSSLWWSIIEEKYYLRPLHILEYEQPLRSIHALNQERDSPIHVFGLAPDCRFFPEKRASEVIECLYNREPSMELHLRSHFPPGSAGLLLVSLGYRHAQQKQTDQEQPPPLGAMLSKDYPITSVLLSGTDNEQQTLCGGLFDKIEQEQIFPLDDTFLSRLTTQCLSSDPYHQVVPLSKVFDHIWIGASPWKQEHILPKEAFIAMESSSLQSWSRFQHELMGLQELGSTPEAWHLWLQPQLTSLKLKEQPFNCDLLPLFQQQH